MRNVAPILKIIFLRLCVVNAHFICLELGLFNNPLSETKIIQSNLGTDDKDT